MHLGITLKKETKAKLTNVYVHYFRPYLTPILQPCDAGIIKALKLRHKIGFTALRLQV
jgi:hypothetical protein